MSLSPLFGDADAFDACDVVDDVGDSNAGGTGCARANFFAAKMASGCSVAFDFRRTTRMVRGKAIATDASKGFFFISPVLAETVTLPTVRLFTTNIMSSKYEIWRKNFEVIFNFSRIKIHTTVAYSFPF